MPTCEALKSLSTDARWEFLKWLAFGQGRYVGILITPSAASGIGSERFQEFFDKIAESPKQPNDSVLNVSFPTVNCRKDESAVVAAIAEYVAARQIALYRNAADFEPSHATEVQEVALRRVAGRFGSSV